MATLAERVIETIRNNRSLVICIRVVGDQIFCDCDALNFPLSEVPYALNLIRNELEKLKP